MRHRGSRRSIRLAVPLDGQTIFHDVLYGTITVDNATLDDLVLLKSDGFPTYHLGIVVDDHLMEISHIMRGDEWLPSVPKHVLLYQAFGWEMPVYAHLPLILAPTGQGKLSKRHGGVEIREFRRQGYLPEAMVNYLARVGWSYDDKTEIFGQEELIRYFDLPGISHSPARFSYEQLEWMNGYYIRQLNADELAERLVPFAAEAGWTITAADLRPVVPLIQERLKTLADVAQIADFFFTDEHPLRPEGSRRPKDDGCRVVGSTCAGAGGAGRRARVRCRGDGAADAGAGRGVGTESGPAVWSGARGRHRQDGVAAAVRVAGRLGPDADSGPPGPGHPGAAGGDGLAARLAFTVDRVPGAGEGAWRLLLRDGRGKTAKRAG